MPGAKALFLDFARQARWRLPVAIALMLAGAMADGFGIVLLVPMIAIATGTTDLPSSLRFLDQFAQTVPADTRFTLALALFLLVMAVRALLIYFRDLAIARLEADYETALPLRAAATLAERGWLFASSVGQAGMQTLLLTHVPRSLVALHHAHTGAVALTMLAIQFALAAFLSPAMTAIAAAMILGGYAVMWGWTNRGLRSGAAMVDSYEHSNSAGFRLHAGLKASLAQGTVAAFLREYRSSLGRLETEVMRYSRDVAAARAINSAGAALAATLLLLIGYRVLALPLPLLIALLILFARMVGPSQLLQYSVQGLAAQIGSFAAIEASLGSLVEPRLDKHGAAPLNWSELRADQVAYEHRPGLGVRNASFALGAGEWLGIGGPSGAGKTTLVDLVTGLVAPQSGQLTVDGRPLAGALLDQFKASLAYVGQGDTVYDDTVRANLVADGGAADDQALWQALEVVALAQRVRELPAGLDQGVGDRGSSLSGGERQRLALARALLRWPALLILDEATSALDSATELRLLERLRGLNPRPAALIIAHKGGALDHCDRRARLERGKLRID